MRTMITRRTLLFAFVATTILTIGFLIFTSRRSEAQILARIEPSYVLPQQPSIQAFFNAEDAQFPLASAKDARTFLDNEMDGDPNDAFEAIEFGYATVVTEGNCPLTRSGESMIYKCRGQHIIMSVDAIDFGDGMVFYR